MSKGTNHTAPLTATQQASVKRSQTAEAQAKEMRREAQVVRAETHLATLATGVSMRRLAGELGISQPTLSEAIARGTKRKAEKR